MKFRFPILRVRVPWFTRRRLLAFVLVGLVLAGVVGALVGSVLGGTDSAEQLEVVFVADTSGATQSVGKDLERGFLEALRSRQQDGVVKVIVRDDAGRPEAVEALAEGAASGFRTLMVIGPSQATGFQSFARAVEEGEVPALVPVAPPSAPNAPRWLFTMQPSQQQFGEFSGRLLNRIQPARRIAFVNLTESGLGGYWNGIAESFSGSGVEAIEPHSIARDSDADSLRREASTLTGFDLVFIDLPADKAAQLVRLLRDRGFRGRIAGFNEMALPDFPDRFSDFPAERLAPGYYTDGLFAIAPFSPDVSGQTSRRLTEAYHARHGKDPSWAYAYGYDAGTLLADFLESRQRGGHATAGAKPEEWRAALREHLEMSKLAARPSSAFSGPLNFDDAHQRDLPPSLLRYADRRASPYPLQYGDQAGRSTSDAPESDRALVVGEKSYDLVPVVFSGIRFQSIPAVDLERSEFTAEFDLWFRSSIPIEAADIVFPTRASDAIESRLIESIDDPNGLYRRIRYQGKFRFNASSRDLLLEKFDLPLSWRHQSLDMSRLRFVVDSASFNTVAVNSPIHEQVNREGALATSLGYVAAASLFSIENLPSRGLGDPRARSGQRWFSTASTALTVQSRGAGLGSLLARTVPTGVAFAFCGLLLLAGLLLGSRWTVKMRPVILRKLIAIFLLALALLFGEVGLFGSSFLAQADSEWLVVLRKTLAVGYYLAVAFALNAVFWSLVHRGRSGTERAFQGTLTAILTAIIFFATFAAYYTNVLGRDFLPILATSSVLLTVIGLAMREVILDAISGVTLHLEGDLKVGHWILLQTSNRSLHGVIEELTWRTICLRSRDDQLHYIPNSMIFQHVLSNFSMRGGYTRVSIPFEVNASVDLEGLIDQVAQAVSTQLSENPDVDSTRSIRIVCQSIEAESAELEAQVFYRASSSVDLLRTSVLQAVNEVLIRIDALPTMQIQLRQDPGLRAISA